MSLVPWLYCTALQFIVVCCVENWELQVPAVHHLFSCKWGPVTANENQMRTILQKRSACGPKSALRTSTAAVPEFQWEAGIWSCGQVGESLKYLCPCCHLLVTPDNSQYCSKPWVARLNYGGLYCYLFCMLLPNWNFQSLISSQDYLFEPHMIMHIKYLF